jgi:hypothetical protein
MKPTLKYYGYVEGGKMMLRRREAIATEVSSVYEGDDIEVSRTATIGGRLFRP